MSAMFTVGQKVAYVGGLRIDPLDPVGPEKGQVYTVSWVGLTPAPYDCINIDLLELPNPDTAQMHRGYDQNAFRPIVERKTDISALTALLNPANHKQREGV